MRDKAMKKAKYAREVPHSSGGAGLAESAGWRTACEECGEGGVDLVSRVEEGEN